MRSVPPRGSGWVSTIADLQLPIANCSLGQTPIGIANRQLSISHAPACMLMACKLESVYQLCQSEAIGARVQQIVHPFGCLEPVR